MSTKTTVPVTHAAQSDPGAGALVVDLEINKVVLDAASARLPLVQNQERERYGKAKTNLSTLAEDILKGWEPGQTRRPPAPASAKCEHCGKVVSTYATGKLRRHGKAGEQCPVSWVSKEAAAGKGRADTRPLRFPMNRAEYDAIKERVHNHGQSVASVVTQRLAHFARHGTL